MATLAALARALLHAPSPAAARAGLQRALAENLGDALRGLGLQEVKAALQQAGVRAARPSAGPLLPLQLLVVALPRTPAQRETALLRLDLAARAAPAGRAGMERA